MILKKNDNTFDPENRRKDTCRSTLATVTITLNNAKGHFQYIITAILMVS